MDLFDWFQAVLVPPRDWLQILQTESITGTSTSTPTTVAKCRAGAGPRNT